MPTEYAGLLSIGDPHLASRIPGFRKDDYPRTLLKKLAWCFDYARSHTLLPAILGDVFHWPRDNANWLLVEIFGLLKDEVLAISGNHDCAENQLDNNDSLMVIAGSGRLRLVDHEKPWRGRLGGHDVIIGGTPWGKRLPKNFTMDHQPESVESSQSEIPPPRDDSLVNDKETVSRNHTEAPQPQTPAVISRVENMPEETCADSVVNEKIIEPEPNTIPEQDAATGAGIFPTDRPLVIWLTHHDLRFPGAEETGRFKLKAIPGIDIIVNGHIHRPLPTVITGTTTWMNPGNIARVARGDSSRNRVPGVLHFTMNARDWQARRVTVPHLPFDEVFHPELLVTSPKDESSSFVRGLAELMARRTESGAGLSHFLAANLAEVEDLVAKEIWDLAREVNVDLSTLAPNATTARSNPHGGSK